MAERAETEFSMIFKNSASKMAAITTATRLLQALLDKPENHNLAEAWARALRSFGEDQLAVAFNTVALTSKGWPTLGDITEPIFDAEYAADWAWIVQGLKRHGVKWQAREARYGVRWRKLGAGIDDWEPGPLLEAEIPAPEIPPRLRAAIGRLAAEDISGGLAELAKHPTFGIWQWEPAEANRIKFGIERDFKAAWMAVRKRELGGGL
jgi:hypothetical protein